MSQTATITVTDTAVPASDADTKPKKKVGSARGRLATVPVYDGSLVIKNKDGKEIHRKKKTVQKWQRKWYNRNTTGVTMKLARVTRNFRGALDQNRQVLKPVAEVHTVAMTRGAAEANLLVMDNLYNVLLGRQGEMCHNHRNGYTGQLTCDIVTRSYNAQGIYLK
jgi:hypothetical protein